jgi:hypothetical protein
MKPCWKKKVSIFTYATRNEAVIKGLEKECALDKMEKQPLRRRKFKGRKKDLDQPLAKS